MKPFLRKLTRPKLLITAAILTTALLLGIPHAFSSNDIPDWYTDVESRHVYKDAISYMTQNNYVEGYEDDTFQSLTEINRVEALKMIIEAHEDEDPILSKEESEEATTSEDEMPEWPDVDPDAWYYEYIETGYEMGLVKGHDDGYFRPEDTVNRAEALKMIYTINGGEIPEEEVDEETEETGNWYDTYVEFGQEYALIVPEEEIDEETEEETIDDEETEISWDYLPGNFLTRGELCEIIYRLRKDKYTGEIEYGIASYYSYGFHEATTASGEPLDAYGYMAAHKTLPFGTWVRVTNLDTELSVNVEIVDRGPYIEGRIIDLTPYATEQIGALSSGLYNVRMELLK
jgi:rare lipoprotein A